MSVDGVSALEDTSLVFASSVLGSSVVSFSFTISFVVLSEDGVCSWVESVLSESFCSVIVSSVLGSSVFINSSLFSFTVDCSTSLVD